MSGPKQRRSQRVILDRPLLVRGETKDKGAFQENALTLIVNAHGALLVLEAKVELGQKLIVTNTKSGDERDATIAYVRPGYDGLATVGIEFGKPAPEFWWLSSPPADWGLS